MNAIIYIIDTLLNLALLVVLLRLFFQWSRADFRNPICQALVRITNPLILPLRRILPPIGKVDTASVVAAVIVAGIYVALMYAVRGIPLPGAIVLLGDVLSVIVRTALWTYFYAILLYAVLSMIAPGGYSPLQAVLASLFEPVLQPFRRIIPPIGGIDLSPLWAGIAIRALLFLVP